MSNKEFEDKELNGTYINLYRQSVISLHAAFLERGVTTSAAREYAIEESQQLMRDMGYTNTLEE